MGNRESDRVGGAFHKSPPEARGRGDPCWNSIKRPRIRWKVQTMKFLPLLRTESAADSDTKGRFQCWWRGEC